MNRYDAHARELSARYNSADPEQVHAGWKHLLPQQAGLALDVGAGSGRDARWLAERGWEVIAAEPSKLMEQAQKYSHKAAHKAITWLDDKLPKLSKVRSLNCRFKLILLSGVWMHLPAAQRETAMRVLSELLAAGGLLVISYRDKPDAAVREQPGFYEVSAEELRHLGRQRALTLLHEQVDQADALGRNDVKWHTQCYQLWDDGTGSLPLLRHIIVNDRKFATYKLGLLRAILWAADRAPGMVLRQDEDWVSLPLGLIGLNWLKMYLPSIGMYQLPAVPRRVKGMSFVKDDFKALIQWSQFDLSIGDRFREYAAAVTGAITDACKTITEMPAHFITGPGPASQIFQSDRKGAPEPTQSIELNQEYLARFGTFQVPRPLWQAFSEYAHWLEPALLNEWVNLMCRWDGSLKHDACYQQLQWRQLGNRTLNVQGRIKTLEQGRQRIVCTWSGEYITEGNTVKVDHCFPWVHWPNNDLWNLLPAARRNNSKEGELLPSAELLLNSGERIKDWWQRAYLENGLQDQFLTQARAAMPLLGESPDLDDIFLGVQCQRQRLRTNQQIAEWHHTT